MKEKFTNLFISIYSKYALKFNNSVKPSNKNKIIMAQKRIELSDQ